MENQPAAPMDLVRRGVEQEVKIAARCTLVAVMEGMRSPKPPVFDCMKLADGTYKATIKIDVPPTRAATDPGRRLKELQGASSASPELAITSAVDEALLYLASSRFVRVQMFSDRVADSYPIMDNWRRVNSVKGGLEKAFIELDDALDTFNKYHRNLDITAKSQTKNGVKTSMAEVYEHMSEIMNPGLEIHNARIKELKTSFGLYLEVHNKYHEEGKNEAKQSRFEGYHQIVEATEKPMLGYVLNYLGWGGPTYGTKYVPVQGYKGHVTITVPDIPDFGCGGEVTIQGMVLSDSREAENHAAYKALRFIEDKFKVIAVDKNYSVRVKARKEHEFLVSLLEDYHCMVDKVRKAWKDLNRCMVETWSYYVTEYKRSVKDKLPKQLIERLDACNKEFEAVCDESIKNSQITAEELKSLAQYSPVTPEAV